MNEDILSQCFSLKGKRSLVTGASGGIGGALAKALAAAGSKVAIHGRDMKALNGLRNEVHEAGGEAFIVSGNLENSEQASKIVDQCVDELGSVDILINNAGMNKRSPASAVSEEDFERITAVNQKSVYFLSQAVYPLMKHNGGGKIVNIASLNCNYALATNSVYGMTKAATAQLAKSLAVEWARDNIQVNALAPGFMLTPLTEPVWNEPHKREWLRSRIPMNRPGSPEDLIAVLLFLVGPGSSYVTGQMFSVDGGFLAGGSWE